MNRQFEHECARSRFGQEATRFGAEPTPGASPGLCAKVRELGIAGVLPFGAAFCAIAIAFLLSLAVAPATPAFAAENTQIDAPVTVSDDVTRLTVNKLDANTHDYVEGATMAIINESTGEVVDSWVTGKDAHENTKTLDVGVTYILRELAAPSGYDTVQDVRFVVNETEGEGITILSSSDDAELTESYKVALYDKPVPVRTETTVTKTTTSSNSASTTTTSTTVAPKTGDETPLSLVAALMAVGVSAILILQVFKRRFDREEE